MDPGAVRIFAEDRKSWNGLTIKSIDKGHSFAMTVAILMVQNVYSLGISYTKRRVFPWD